MEDLPSTADGSRLPTPPPQVSKHARLVLETLLVDQVSSIDEKRSALLTLREVRDLPESTCRELSTALLITYHTIPGLKTEVTSIGAEFAQNNAASLEVCRLAVALLSFPETPRLAREALQDVVAARVAQRPDVTENASSELRGFCRLIIESVNVEEVREGALESIHHLLSTNPRVLNQHRTLLAREVLHLFRSNVLQHAEYAPLRDLATKLYILGAAHSRARVQSLSRINYSPAPCEESHEEKEARAAKLLPKLIEAGVTRQSIRLSLDDFRAIATLKGLPQGDFKAVAASILRDALVDSSALAGLLSLVKNGHDSSVTMEMRTGCLAALIGEARRAGKLSQTLEQSVLATSAELPRLYNSSGVSHDLPEMALVKE